MSGTLYLMPTPIADGTLQQALPSDVIALCRRVEHFLAEDAKSARAFLKQVRHPRPLRELSIVDLYDSYLEGVLAGLATPKR